jgi:hypothetical protein
MNSPAINTPPGPCGLRCLACARAQSKPVSKRSVPVFEIHGGFASFCALARSLQHECHSRTVGQLRETWPASYLASARSNKPYTRAITCCMFMTSRLKQCQASTISSCAPPSSTRAARWPLSLMADCSACGERCTVLSPWLPVGRLSNTEHARFRASMTSRLDDHANQSQSGSTCHPPCATLASGMVRLCRRPLSLTTAFLVELQLLISHVYLNHGYTHVAIFCSLPTLDEADTFTASTCDGYRIPPTFDIKARLLVSILLSSLASRVTLPN